MNGKEFVELEGRLTTANKRTADDGLLIWWSLDATQEDRDRGYMKAYGKKEWEYNNPGPASWISTIRSLPRRRGPYKPWEHQHS